MTLLSNHKLLTGFVALITVLFLSIYASATTYYVDFEDGLDNNDGLSPDPSGAWKHAPGDSAGPARSLTPGDIVLFKGGVVYGGTININADGNSSNPITYKGNGWPTPEGEKAIFDGSTSYPFYLGTRSYVTIEGFKMQNLGIAGISAGPNAGTGLTIKDNELTNIIGSGSGAIQVYGTDYVIIEGNYVYHPRGMRGIYGDVKGGTAIIRNNTVIDTQGSAMRFDAVGAEVIVIDNEIYDVKGVTSANGITIYPDGAGTYVSNTLVAGNRVIDALNPYAIHFTEDVTVYNNVFYAGFSDDTTGTGAIAVWSNVNNMKVLNNVLLGTYGGGDTITGSGTIDNLIFKNNIVTRPVDKPGDISHNIYTVSGSSSGTDEIFEPDLDIIFENPTKNPSPSSRPDPAGDYHLIPDSPAIDAGDDITAILNELQEQYGEYYDFFKDRDGNPRPSGAVGGLYAEGEGAHTNTKASMQAFDMTVFWTVTGIVAGAGLCLAAAILTATRWTKRREGTLA